MHIAGSVVAIAALAVFGGAPTSERALSPASAPKVALLREMLPDVGLRREACDADCWTHDFWCSYLDHATSTATNKEFKYPHPNDCLPPGDCGYHICAESLRDVRMIYLVDRAGDGDMEAILELLRSFPEKATVNLGRRALQVASCKDPAALMAHLPLTAPQMASIQQAGVLVE